MWATFGVVRNSLIAVGLVLGATACGHSEHANADMPSRSKVASRGPVVEAQRYAPVRWQRQALATAQRVWHPACGVLSLRFATPPAQVPESGLWTGWAYNGDCVINIRASTRWAGYPDFCSTVLHEAGHAAGLGHSANPRSIMYPDHTISVSSGRENGRHVTHWTGADARCIRPVDRD